VPAMGAVGQERGDTAGSEEGAVDRGREGSAACLDLAGMRERVTGSAGVESSRWVRTPGWGSALLPAREVAMAARQSRCGARTRKGGGSEGLGAGVSERGVRSFRMS
jgi:hypothetical protein